jgi:hypothetical protein
MIAESVATAVITVIIGVAVYALSQIVSKFVIEPIHKQDEIRGEISHSLAFYANVYGNPGSSTSKHSEATDKFREQACLLASKTRLIRKYGFFSAIGLVPCAQNVQKACGNLIGLSNCINKTGSSTQNVQWAEEIRKLLRI